MAKHMSMLNHICREPGPTAAPALAGQKDEEKKPDMLSLAVFSQSARLHTGHSVPVCFA